MEKHLETYPVHHLALIVVLVTLLKGTFIYYLFIIFFNELGSFFNTEKCSFL